MTTGQACAIPSLGVATAEDASGTSVAGAPAGAGGQFNLGDRVWFARYVLAEVREPCPICFGALWVTLVLGNGDDVRLECDYCGKGYGSPRGYVTTNEIRPSASRHTIERVSTLATAVEYQSDRLILDGDRTFATEAEAMERAVSLAAEAQADRAKSAAYSADHNAKGKPWSAGYHLRNAEEHRKRAAYHENKAALIKAEKRAAKAGAK